MIYKKNTSQKSMPNEKKKDKYKGSEYFDYDSTIWNN